MSATSALGSPKGGAFAAWRVAQILVERGEGRQEVRGSGYLVTPTAILTAAHLLQNAVSVAVALDVGQPTEIDVTLDAESWIVDSAPIVGSDGASPGTDLAVLSLPNTVTDGREVVPAEFSRVDRGADEVVSVVSYGFPRYKLRAGDPMVSPGLQVRDIDVVRADMPTTANRRQGTLALYLQDPPPRDEPDDRDSPWAGFSGASIWYRGRIIGVVGEHHRPEGPGRLTGRRIDALSAAEAPELAGLRSALGISEIAEWTSPPLPPLTPARLVTDWSPLHLGVHASIGAVTQASELTEYIAREHDRVLVEALRQYFGEKPHPQFLVCVGTSCSGKTRALYEALRKTLPSWHLVAPPNESELARVLESGVPNETVIWLDELQDKLTLNTDGARAARLLIGLLRAEPSPSPSPQIGTKYVLVAGTIWPSNLEYLRQRPDAAAASQGLGSVANLFHLANFVEVPQDFRGSAKDTASASGDDRVRHAAQTAVRDGGGIRLTQVLAGGERLVARMFPEATEPHTDRFGSGAAALLRAFADLRRVGMPNPLPPWAPECAREGYLHRDARQHLDPRYWLADAIQEVTENGAREAWMAKSPLRPQDNFQEGVPAVLRIWGSRYDPESLFSLHDYLLQEIETRHYFDGVPDNLWHTLVIRHRDLPPNALLAVANAALSRGRFETASELLLDAHGLGSLSSGLALRLQRYYQRDFGRDVKMDMTSVRNAQTLRDIWLNSAYENPNRRLGDYRRLGYDAPEPLQNPKVRPGLDDPRARSGHIADLVERSDREGLLSIGRIGDTAARTCAVALLDAQQDQDLLTRLSRAGWTAATMALLRAADHDGPLQLDQSGHPVPWDGEAIQHLLTM